MLLRRPEAATVNAADAVFTGTVTARLDPAAGSPTQSSIDPITYSLAVDDELKGDVDATALVETFGFIFLVAFGILRDTFLVRSVLVPALVTELGDRVWWPSTPARRGHGSAEPARR